MDKYVVLARDDLASILYPRPTRSKGAVRAKTYICQVLKSLGYNVMTQSFRNQQCSNVVACYPNNNARSYIVVGAHYDSVANSVGADDNASGVAALLCLARLLKQGVLHRQDIGICMVWFDSEETGCHGSLAFVRSKWFHRMMNKTLFMINMDMVGRVYTRGHIRAIASRPWQKWRAMMKSSSYPIELLDTKHDIGTSDYGNFATVGIPFVSLSSGTSHHNHTHRDTLDKIEPTSCVIVAMMIVELIHHCSAR
jgi:Zn-dependent M28 family amino/carboxypeptidase